MTSDAQIQEQIEALERERLKLREHEGFGDETLQTDRARLEQIRVELDRLWDLRRQRTALRDAGEDPGYATERSANEVENYQQ